MAAKVGTAACWAARGNPELSNFPTDTAGRAILKVFPAVASISVAPLPIRVPGARSDLVAANRLQKPIRHVNRQAAMLESCFKVYERFLRR